MTELKKYQRPKLLVTVFDSRDVITLSQNSNSAAIDVEAGWMEEQNP